MLHIVAAAIVAAVDAVFLDAVAGVAAVTRRNVQPVLASLFYYSGAQNIGQKQFK